MIEILAIDDDAAILSLIRRALERDGYRVTTVTDARTLEAAELCHYELILLDVTGDLYEYGVVKSAKTNSSQGMGIGGVYTCVIDGTERTVSSQKEFPVFHIPVPASFPGKQRGNVPGRQRLLYACFPLPLPIFPAAPKGTL